MDPRPIRITELQTENSKFNISSSIMSNRELLMKLTNGQDILYKTGHLGIGNSLVMMSLFIKRIKETIWKRKKKGKT